MFYIKENNQFGKKSYEIFINTLFHILIHDSGDGNFLIEVIEKRIIRKDKVYGTTTLHGGFQDVVRASLNYAHDCLSSNKDITVSDINWSQFEQKVMGIAQRIK